MFRPRLALSQASQAKGGNQKTDQRRMHMKRKTVLIFGVLLVAAIGVYGAWQRRRDAQNQDGTSRYGEQSAFHRRAS